MGIVPENGEMFTVVGENHPDRDQSTYMVDLRRGRCSCADSEYWNAECKHQRRAAFALGREPVPAAIAPSDVPGELGGEHLDGEPRFLATDGGAVAGDTGSDHPADDTPERSRVPVAGGVLVYEQRAVGKELVGFENVDDWDALADALAAKGHDRGAVFHLLELDE
jgi:hypothetical protein